MPSEKVRVGLRFDTGGGIHVVAGLDEKRDMALIKGDYGDEKGAWHDVDWCQRLLDSGKWRPVPSSQPEKVEPRVGQTWKGRMGDVETMLSEASDRRGEWYTASGCIVTPKWFEHATLISTGEAEKRTGLLDVGAATLTISAELNEQLARELNENREREVNRAMVAHNDAFHEKEKARILADYEAQRKEPAYQPHWQRTGVQAYSRRVPR